MIRKPIHCKCGLYSWTRRQLLAAWENNLLVRCPEATCGREITPQDIEELLRRIGVLNIKDEE